MPHHLHLEHGKILLRPEHVRPFFQSSAESSFDEPDLGLPKPGDSGRTAPACREESKTEVSVPGAALGLVFDAVAWEYCEGSSGWPCVSCTSGKMCRSDKPSPSIVACSNSVSAVEDTFYTRTGI